MRRGAFGLGSVWEEGIAGVVCVGMAGKGEAERPSCGVFIFIYLFYFFFGFNLKQQSRRL